MTLFRGNGTPRPHPPPPLVARLEATAGDPTTPAPYRAFAPGDAMVGVPYDHPICGEEFIDALNSLRSGAEHRIGGHAQPIISAVELWAARDDLGLGWDDPRLLPEAEEWALLAQFDSDPETGMEWGDGGTVHWTMRRQDLAGGRFERAVFTWQSG